MDEERTLAFVGGWCCCCCYKYGKARSQITCSFYDMEIKYMNKMIMTYFRKREACGLQKVLRCEKVFP